jgi:hypothetical protein
MASFFDTLFGGAAEREAAERNRAALDRYVQDGNAALDRGLVRSEDALRTGVNSANRYLTSNYGLYDDLRNTGTAILDRGRADSLAALKDVGAVYDPVAALGARYGAGTQLYLDSIGVNGADGHARAQAAFNAGPGYAFARDQGIEALNRRRAAAGMLNSGNADIDALTYGTGLANQTYGSWQDRLAGLINPELNATSTAATGRAGAASNIANVIGQDTAARLGLAQGVTAGQAGVNAARGANDVALGNSLAGLYTGDAGNRVNIAGNNVSGQMAANNLEAQGQAQGARNLLNGTLSLASLAAGAFGGGGMFGSGGAFAPGGAFGSGAAAGTAPRLSGSGSVFGAPVPAVPFANAPFSGGWSR